MKTTEIAPRVEWDHDHPVIIAKAADIIKPTLKEATFKEIKSLFDDDFLRQKERSQTLEGFRKFGFDGDTITYYVPSAHTRDAGHHMHGKGYHVRIQFSAWPQLVSDPDLNASEASWMAFWLSDLKMHCACESLLYYYQYLLTAIDASIYPEIRKPVKMNPQERGICCKHIRRVLTYLPTNLTDLAVEIRNQRNMSPELRNSQLEKKKKQQDMIAQNKVKDQQAQIVKDDNE